jgi:hypothetical protein
LNASPTGSKFGNYGFELGKLDGWEVELAPVRGTEAGGEYLTKKFSKRVKHIP